MGKKWGSKKGEMSGIAEQDGGDRPDSVYPDVRGGDDVDFSQHERKKRKRKHESCSGVADESASAGENAEVGADAKSKRERTKEKLVVDNDREEGLEKPRKKDKKRKREPHVVPLIVEDSDNGVRGKRYDKKSASEYNNDVRSKFEGVKSIEKKKSEHNLGDDEWVGPVGVGKEQGTEAVKTTDQLDSLYGDNSQEEEKKKDKKKKKKEKDKLSKKSSRKVRFSDKAEIFPASGGPSEGNGTGNDQLVWGKRFSLEEDALIKKAVYKFIEDHGLGEDGVTMVLHCRKNAETRHCWKEITAALPWRPYCSVYLRAHTLFERSETRSWTNEELELIRKFRKAHRTDWKTLADALGKHNRHVRDTWRRIRRPNLNKGQWTQEEYQTLFDLVNKDLQMKAMEEKESKHGMLRDNICWESISEKLSTRMFSRCCTKWYKQLTSPMVAEGIWANTDDYKLLNALVNLDACSMEDVDWDCLIKNRSGKVCRKRWAQMVSHIGEHGMKSFIEQVEILSKRYCPDLLEARESWDKKIPKD